MVSQTVMNRYVLFIYLLFFVGTAFAQQDENFYFYSTEDISNIKSSSKTKWGNKILGKLAETIAEREKHSLAIPALEGGHGHHYFCPIHNTQFVFDWESPKAHYCAVCKKKWSDVDRYDWAWVNFVHGANLDYLKANMYLYLATDEKRYADNITSMLLDLSHKYPAYKIHDRERKYTPGTSGKLFSQSLDEAVWAIDAARAFLVASVEMTLQERLQIEKGFLRPCADLLLSSRDKGNWQVWHNGGIIALGVALKNDSIINAALNKPDLGYYDMQKKNVYNDGWWNEGSVVYHFYPLRAILLSAEAVRCRHINLYDEKVINMFLSPVNMLYSDLMFPSQNDGWYGTTLLEQAGLYEIVALRTGNQKIIDVLAACYEKIERKSPDALINGMELKSHASGVSLSSHLFPDLGVGVLRSKNKTVVLKNGPSGGVHGHPDKLSISIHDGRREILPDLGTTAYGVPDCYAWYRKTISHNTVTIDKKDQKASKGKIVLFKPTSCGGVIEAVSDSTYVGVNMHRTLSLEGIKLVDHFTCESDVEHTYDYTLILRDSISLPSERKDTLLEYERISKVRRSPGKGTFSFSMSDGTKLSLEVHSPYELFIGVAPGIPPKGLKKGEDVYPLIIRTKGKKMDIKTIWTVVD